MTMTRGRKVVLSEFSFLRFMLLLSTRMQCSRTPVLAIWNGECFADVTRNLNNCEVIECENLLLAVARVRSYG